MRRLTLTTSIVLGMLLLCCGSYAQLLFPETEYSKAAQEVMNARLGQIALMVQRESGGKSRLLLSSGQGAFTSTGIIVRRMDWGGIAPVRAYRVSEPFDIDIDGMRQCRFLGALFLNEQATIIGGQRISAGVYLLAYSPNAQRIAIVESRITGDGKVSYHQLGRVALENPNTGRGAAEPYVGVWFPTEELLADDNPCNRVTIDLAWKRESYMFRPVDVNFIML